MAEYQDQIELVLLAQLQPSVQSRRMFECGAQASHGQASAGQNNAKLRETAHGHMAMLEQKPERVIGYFQDRHFRYAA